MSDIKFPTWLEPYKSEWRSMSRLQHIMAFEGRPFSSWFLEVRGRLRSISMPATNGKPATQYLVKHVWAAARAHNITVVPTEQTEPLEGKYALLREKAAELEAELERKRREIAGLQDRSRVLGDLLARAGKSMQAADLIRLAFTMSEPRGAPGVYFLLQEDGQCTYVGQSKNVLSRMVGHGSKDFHTVRMVRVQDQAARLALETQMIELLQPRDNVHGIRKLEAA